MIIQENSYGINKRLSYISQLIEQRNPIRVLDFGCGTGLDITFPLALQFPYVKFYGIDSDHKSIDYAKQNFMSQNTVFYVNNQLQPDQVFDIIICSEVLEHVENPGDLLIYLAEKLSPDGNHYNYTTKWLRTF